MTLPDDLFERADEAAVRLRMSRSRFYQAAVEAFLQRLDEEKLTEKMNAFVDRHGQAVGESLEAYVATAWAREHGDDEW